MVRASSYVSNSSVDDFSTALVSQFYNYLNNHTLSVEI